MPQPTQRSGISMAVRSSLWILVSVAFLVQVAVRIHRDRLAGQPVTNWVVAQLVLWSVILCFWTFGLVWDWKRRRDARKVV
jgi:hypothetical protein